MAEERYQRLKNRSRTKLALLAAEKGKVEGDLVAAKKEIERHEAHARTWRVRYDFMQAWGAAGLLDRAKISAELKEQMRISLHLESDTLVG